MDSPSDVKNRLESVLAGVLNRFLSAYVSTSSSSLCSHPLTLTFSFKKTTTKPRGTQVDNLNTGQLNIGIWSGDVKLKNLRLKKEALDKFRLPVDVVEGYLGDLTLSIPWYVSSLDSVPVDFFSPVYFMS